MKISEKTFTVDNYEFRAKQLTCTQFLALETILNFTDFDKCEQMFSTILESMEVKVNDSWQQVKATGIDSYIPVELSENLRLMYKVCMLFINKILTPVFQKSTESK